MDKTSKFTKFGKSFQSKLVASLFTDRQFLEQIQDILNPDYFESDSNKWLVKEIKGYFVKYKKLPTLEAVKVILNDVENDLLKASIVESLKGAYQHFEASDLDFVQEKSLDFCKNQEIQIFLDH